MALAKGDLPSEVRALAVEHLGYLVGAHYVPPAASSPVVLTIIDVMQADPDDTVRARAEIALNWARGLRRNAAHHRADDRVRQRAGPSADEEAANGPSNAEGG